MNDVFNFYKGKRVLVTGHTGFKGAWLCKILTMAGAQVCGYALEPQPDSLYSLILLDNVKNVYGDIRDYKKLKETVDTFLPEIVIHLAAQPLVREAYNHPRYTYEANVMGTVNICECIRTQLSVKSFLNVTTDKVYKNNEWCYGYRENEPLDGYDPYSNSKSCSELVTHSYINSYFRQNGRGIRTAVSTARAGNVIGGGDFAQDRIIPDCVRAIHNNEVMIVRNPDSIRPYQHVLEPLFLYLLICAEQYENYEKAGFYNVGPDDVDCITTRKLVSLFSESFGNGFKYEVKRDSNSPHEANILKLDTSYVRSALGWKPKWRIEEAVQMTVDWIKVWLTNASCKSINEIMEKQILIYRCT